jgi:hypothetical protein
VRLFRNGAFSGVVAANLLSVLGLSGLVFFLSQFFQLVQASTAYLRLGIALFVVGVGLGLAFTAASDVIIIIGSVMPERADAAAAVSETAYELGMALGIATLGSVITAVYRGLAIPPGTPDAVAAHARESLAAAVDASARLPGAAIGVGSCGVAVSQAAASATTEPPDRHALLAAEHVLRVVFRLDPAQPLAVAAVVLPVGPGALGTLT